MGADKLIASVRARFRDWYSFSESVQRVASVSDMFAGGVRRLDCATRALAVAVDATRALAVDATIALAEDATIALAEDSVFMLFVSRPRRRLSEALESIGGGDGWLVAEVEKLAE